MKNINFKHLSNYLMRRNSGISPELIVSLIILGLLVVEKVNITLDVNNGSKNNEEKEAE